jgi:hypothetical protein
MKHILLLSLSLLFLLCEANSIDSTKNNEPGTELVNEEDFNDADSSLNNEREDLTSYFVQNKEEQEGEESKEEDDDSTFSASKLTDDVKKQDFLSNKRAEAKKQKYASAILENFDNYKQKSDNIIPKVRRYADGMIKTVTDLRDKVNEVSEKEYLSIFFSFYLFLLVYILFLLLFISDIRLLLQCLLIFHPSLTTPLKK